MSQDLCQITKPTLLVKENILRRNIEKMVSKLPNLDKFRPHFKTHQNISIGRIFREFGTKKITVSSITMAKFFAADGWKDITIAIPINLREIDEINDLAKIVKLGLIIDSIEAAEFLIKNIKYPINLWLEINVGQNRSGFDCKNLDEIKKSAKKILSQKNNLIILQGILTHAGHSYSCKNKKEIKKLYQNSLAKMNLIKSTIKTKNWQPLISIGDTPCCSIIDSFDEVDEIRPGNFVYYDISQEKTGSCTQKDIAVAIALPVISINEARCEAVVYGGAIHLSKEFIHEKSQDNYGAMVLFKNGKWQPLPKQNKLVKLSQEHGILKLENNILKDLKIGDLIYIQPIHSCLSADLLKENTIIF